MSEDTFAGLASLAVIIIIVSLLAAFVIAIVRDVAFGTFERAELRTLPDGQSWICHSKRAEWKGEIENHCVRVEDVVDGGGN